MNSLNRTRFAGTRISHIITLLATAAMPMLGGSWTAINSGLPGASLGVVALTIDPAVPSTLYACSSAGDVFKSNDGAASWQPVSGVGGANVLVIDPHKTSTLYAATRTGILKSTDGGASWQSANSGLTGFSVSWLALDPTTSATLYAATSSGLFKSTDAGGSWSSLNSGLPSNASIQSVYLDPLHPSTIYAVGSNDVIFKSADGGTSWAALNTVPDTIFTVFADSLAIDPVNSNMIYAGTFAAGYGNIAKSADIGQSWKVVSTGLSSSTYVMSLTIDPTAPSTLYASYEDISGSGLLKSTDGGQSWNVAKVVHPGDQFFTAEIAIDPSAPSTIYAGYSNPLTGEGGVLKSTDSGQTWNAANAGLSNFNIRLLAIDPFNAATVYVSEGDTLFKSVDRGASWSNLGNTPVIGYPAPYQSTVIRSMLVNSTDPDILFVETAGVGGCGSVLYKSIDGGASWNNSSPSEFGGCVLSGLITADPTNSTTYYAGVTDDVDGAYWLARSVNGGANWDFAWNGGQGFDSSLNALVVDPTNPAILYAGIGDGLYKSYDGGVTSNIVGFRNSTVTALAIDPSNPLTLYANVAGQGLFKSTDGGASWLAINNGLSALIETRSSVTALVVTRGNSNVLYAATAGLGIYRSIDGGANWNPFNDGLTSQNVNALIVGPGTPSTIYAGTSAGIFEMDDAPQRPGTISANPNPCVLSGFLCTAYITWSTTGLSNAEVWVRVGNGPESPFAFATSCSNTDCPAPWIEGGGAVYTFTLYDCSSVNCEIDHTKAPEVGAVQVRASK